MIDRVTYDLDTMTAIVERDIVEKYARKLLNDKLKAETGYAVWSCFLTNRQNDDDTHYRFEIRNGYIEIEKALIANGQPQKQRR